MFTNKISRTGKSLVLGLLTYLAPNGKMTQTEAGSLHAAESACECGKRHFLIPEPVVNLPGKKYARDRLMDIEHVALDVVPDFKLRSVRGTMRLNAQVVGLPLVKVELDAVDMDVDAVLSEPACSDWQNTGEKLVVWFPKELAPGTAVKLNVSFATTPRHGLYFRTPEMGYPAGDTQLWTQGEPELHRHWFPCYDYPNERFTSEVRCTVPQDMQVSSNGRLLGKEPAGPGMQAWHWRQEQPHVNYLIALAAGYFHRLEAKSGDVPLALSVPPSLKETAEWAFRDTVAIMDFLQQEIGVKYPWAKYDQVYCHDFLAGGMENTSCTLMAASELFPPTVETVESVEGLDAHEMAHQWFGDLVTCRDWSHLWLNEGFASFYPMLYRHKKAGGECYQEELWHAAQRVIGSDDPRPMVWREYTDPMQQFDSRAYPKGAWVLHMLRSQLGPDLFRKGIATYLERHRNGIATSDDLQDVLEEVSGRSFDRFFDQWLHQAGLPELKAKEAWNAAEQLSSVTIEQVQKVSATVPIFHFPLPVRFILKDDFAPVTKILHITQASETFSVSLPSQPIRVDLDPGFTVLAKWQGETSLGNDKTSVAGPLHSRMRAIRALADKKNAEAVALLKKQATEDGNVSCRVEAVQTLQKHASKESTEALISLAAAEEARVRVAVTRALLASPFPEAISALQARWPEEKNPAIRPLLVSSLAMGRAQLAERVPKLLEIVQSSSWQESDAAAAMRALKGLDAREAVPIVLAKLAKEHGKFPKGLYSEALENLAFLARYEPGMPAEQRKQICQPVLDFLAEQVASPRESIRQAAVQAIGTLGDPAGAAVLSGMANATRRNTAADPLRTAAASVLAKLKAQDKGAPALENIWTELKQLKKQNEDLEAELKKMKGAKPQK